MSLTDVAMDKTNTSHLPGLPRASICPRSQTLEIEGRNLCILYPGLLLGTLVPASPHWHVPGLGWASRVIWGSQFRPAQLPQVISGNQLRAGAGRRGRAAPPSGAILGAAAQVGTILTKGPLSSASPCSGNIVLPAEGHNGALCRA